MPFNVHTGSCDLVFGVIYSEPEPEYNTVVPLICPQKIVEMYHESVPTKSKATRIKF